MPDYPKREPYFAHRFVRLLFKTCAAQEIGIDACYLLVHIAHTEDAKRYKGPVTFHNEQLQAILGFKKWERLDRARRAACRANWLHYQPPPNRRRQPGRYFVTIPAELEDVDDLPIDEASSYPSEGDDQGDDPRQSYPPEGYGQGDDQRESYPSEGDGPGQSYPSQGDGEGDGRGDDGGEPSTLPLTLSLTSGATSAPPGGVPPGNGGFDHFWNLYPSRNGRKREKAKASAQWKRLSASDRQRAIQAAPTYAAEEKFIKDAFRWLRDRSFEDWLTPQEPERSAVATKQDIEAAGYTFIEDDE